jgi:uncharacterized damage-inducible protein DinB
VHVNGYTWSAVPKGEIIMPTSSPVLDAILQGWKAYQDQLVFVVRTLTTEQLALRVAPNLRSAGEIAAHLVTGRADWFFGVLEEGGDEIAAITQWQDPGQPARTADELAYGLEVTWTLMQSAFSRWTLEELTESIMLPWIGPKHPITRSWVLWHVLEHDLHHGGELAQTLGLRDPNVKLPPPPPDI